MAEPAGLAFAFEHGRGPLALRVDLEVGASETLALMGPSGAGKSTCLGLIAGLERPDRGRVRCGAATWCDTERGRDLPPERREAGVLFQDHALFPHLSIRDNAAYGLLARGAPREEALAAADHWLRRLGIAGSAGRRPRDLSGGERQRAALARALASGARALLLDEPFAALDATTRAVVRSELMAMLREAALPVVLVTHDPVDALALGDRIAVMEEGQLTQVGTHDELWLRPRTAFVADLAGRNLYPADVPPGGGLKEVRAGGLVFHVLADGVAGAAYLVFAPSDVMLSAARHPASAQNVFDGTVRELRRAGGRTFVLLDAGGAAMTAEITDAAASALALAPGRTVVAAVKSTAIHVYP